MTQPNTQGAGPQHVVKAEGASPDATDRVRPFNSSAGVGPMRAGQPADAGPPAIRVDTSATSCTDCAVAAARRWHGFTAGCRGCCARAAGRSPQFAAARKAGDRYDRPYVRLLDQFGLTHAEVHAAAAADRASRA